MNKTETILLFQKLMLEIEKLNQKQNQILSELKDMKEADLKIIKNQVIIWEKIKQM